MSAGVARRAAAPSIPPTRIWAAPIRTGSCFEVDELLDALAAVDGRAVVFPLAEPGGYRAANDRRLAAAARLTAGHPAEEYLELDGSPASYPPIIPTLRSLPRCVSYSTDTPGT